MEQSGEVCGYCSWDFFIALNFELIQDEKSDEWFSFSGVLIHEVSHNFFVLNTEDICYTTYDAKDLKDNIKTKNATNWEYFYLYSISNNRRKIKNEE